jgi:hypothetical protein
MIRQRKGISEQPPVSRMVEDMVGCKWSLAVLGRIRAGVRRPGEIERAIAGLSKKVMNERLRKLQRYGIVDKYVCRGAATRRVPAYALRCAVRKDPRRHRAPAAQPGRCSGSSGAKRRRART